MYDEERSPLLTLEEMHDVIDVLVHDLAARSRPASEPARTPTATWVRQHRRGRWMRGERHGRHPEESRRQERFG